MSDFVPDKQRKARIANWLKENVTPVQYATLRSTYYAPELQGLGELLLKFEKYLGDCEDERMKA